MSVIQSTAIDSYGGSGGGIMGNSLRLRSSASAVLTRTQVTPTATDTATFSIWIKSTKLYTSSGAAILATAYNSGAQLSYYTGGNPLRVASGGAGIVSSTALFRDTSAWYHHVFRFTAGSWAVYTNNVLTFSGTNTIGGLNRAAQTQRIGNLVGAADFLDAYISEVNFVDGQVLTPDAFGEYDAVTGQWVPKAYSGSFGANGFYLDFKDGTSLTTLGYDKSGNNNHWTLNNISLTDNTTYDWTSDSPVNSALQLRSAASAKIERTPTVAGNRKTWTLATSVRRKTAGIIVPIFSGTTDSGVSLNYGTAVVYFTAANKIRVMLGTSNGAIACEFVTNASFTSTTADYHIVVAVDTTQTTIGSGLQMWVDGIAQTNTSTTYTQNFESNINNTTSQVFGYFNIPALGGPVYSNINLSSTTFVDGLALPASSFGQTINSVWTPVKYTGTYGTNGVYLDYSNHTNVASLGLDSSGNGNTFTTTNVSLIYRTYDWMNDYPTNNYCTLNLLKQYTAQTLTQGALNYYTPTDSTILGTQGVSSGKWYWEVFVVTNSGGQASIGVSTDVFNPPTNAFDFTPYGYTYLGSANKRNNGIMTAYGVTYTNSDVIGVALDMDTRALVFYKNGVSQGTAYTVTAGTYFPALGNGNSSGVKEYAINFGQRPFQYTPPTGYKTLCTQNLPDPAVKKSVTAYKSIIATGATIKATAQGIFPNELAWMRDTVAAANGQVADSARGINSILQPNTTAIGSAFVTPTNASLGFVWNMGTSAANTTGTISSTTWANPISGVSVVTYTGTGVAGTIGHDIGKAPAFILVKKTSDVGDWVAYHQTQGATKHILLNSAAGSVTATRWNNTAPTASVFSVGTDTTVNAAGATYVAYCFAEIDGFSKFGSYTGNSSTDGPFINLGFRPSFWMHKSFDGSGHWNVYDAAWDTGNVMTNIYYANNTSLGAGNPMDMVSNGVKVRANATGYNISGVQYFYIAFAEAPFKYALAR